MKFNLNAVLLIIAASASIILFPMCAEKPAGRKAEIAPAPSPTVEEMVTDAQRAMQTTTVPLNCSKRYWKRIRTTSKRSSSWHVSTLQWEKRKIHR